MKLTLSRTLAAAALVGLAAFGSAAQASQGSLDARGVLPAAVRGLESASAETQMAYDA